MHNTIIPLFFFKSYYVYTSYIRISLPIGKLSDPRNDHLLPDKNYTHTPPEYHTTHPQYHLHNSISATKELLPLPPLSSYTAISGTLHARGDLPTHTLTQCERVPTLPTCLRARSLAAGCTLLARLTLGPSAALSLPWEYTYTSRSRERGFCVAVLRHAELMTQKERGGGGGKVWRGLLMGVMRRSGYT